MENGGAVLEEADIDINLTVCINTHLLYQLAEPTHQPLRLCAEHALDDRDKHRQQPAVVISAQMRVELALHLILRTAVRTDDSSIAQCARSRSALCGRSAAIGWFSGALFAPIRAPALGPAPFGPTDGLKIVRTRIVGAPTAVTGRSGHSRAHHAPLNSAPAPASAALSCSAATSWTSSSFSSTSSAPTPRASSIAFSSRTGIDRSSPTL